MITKRFHRYIFFTTTLLIIFFGCFQPSEGFKAHYVSTITREILNKHVNQNEYTDEISALTLDNMIKLVDPFKLYFLQSDIDSFQKHKTKLDDYNKSSDYSFVAEFFQVYKKRFDERMKLLTELLSKEYDFSIDETMEIDRKKVKFATNEEQVKERWRKRIKFQLLNYVNTQMTVKEGKKKVKKYYTLLKKDVEKYDEERIASIYLNAFSQALDPHSAYMTAEVYEDFLISMNLKLEGIGAVLRSEDGFVFVDSVIPGGPVSKMDPDKTVKPNDKIIAVAQGDGEPEDVIDVPLRDAVKLIRGKKGTVVKLSVLRKDEESNKEKMIIIPIVRDRVILEQQAAKYAIHEIEKDGKKKKMGYIKLPSFYMDWAAHFKKDPSAKMASKDVLEALLYMKEQKVDGVVFDLRGNPGGALREAVRIAGFFIKYGPVLMVKHHSNIRTHFDEDKAMQYDGPVVVLVDSSSASASEIFAGAIRDYKRGLILGPTRTFGKGSVQDLHELSAGGAIKVTIQLFYQPDGTSNNKDGIYPHITIPSASQLSEFYESELDNPLDWKQIPAANYTSFGDTYLSKPLIAKLSTASQKRVAADTEFQELQKKINEYKAKKDEKSISLKQEKLDDDKESENKKEEKQDKKDKVYDLESDIFLKEAFNITSEYIDSYKK